MASHFVRVDRHRIREFNAAHQFAMAGQRRWLPRRKLHQYAAIARVVYISRLSLTRSSIAPELVVPAVATTQNGAKARSLVFCYVSLKLRCVYSVRAAFTQIRRSALRPNPQQAGRLIPGEWWASADV